MNIFKLVPCMSHVRCIVYCRSTTVPKHSSAFLWYKHILVGRNKKINEHIQSLTSNGFYLSREKVNSSKSNDKPDIIIQINHNIITHPTGKRQTSWLFSILG